MPLILSGQQRISDCDNFYYIGYKFWAGEIRKPRQYYKLTVGGIIPSRMSTNLLDLP